MSKYLIIQMPDGSKWKVDAAKVATNRADYYTKYLGLDCQSSLWKSEYSFCFDDNFELKNWCLGNMNWNELEAELVRPAPVPAYDTWLTNGAILNVITEEGK